MNAWIDSAEQKPESGIPVLVAVTSGNGSRTYRRILRAEYAAPKTLLAYDDLGEYDEAADEYYCVEGWYESNEYEDVHWRINDAVTHWQPLPKWPEEGRVTHEQAMSVLRGGVGGGR